MAVASTCGDNHLQGAGFFNVLANIGYIPLVTVCILMDRDCVNPQSFSTHALLIGLSYLFPGGEVNRSGPCISVSEP